MEDEQPIPFDEQLRREREQFREFVWMAAHDLREPLRMISAYSDLLFKSCGEQLNADAHRSRCYIREGIQRMESLLRDMVEYFAADDLRPVRINMEVVLRHARMHLQNEMEAIQAVITHDALPLVMGDVNALTKVLTNLIDNACKFRGKLAPRIHISSTRHGEEWLFSVRDNGLGFKSIYSERVFEPFKRLHGKRYSGSGLGLALTKRIIEQHGGRIWATSAVGEGSTFWFTLPAAGSD